MPQLVSIQISGTLTAYVGGTQQLALTALFSDGSTSDVTSTAAWSSLAPAVAQVSTTGLATAEGAGTTRVSASYGGLSAATYFTVPALVSTAIVAPPAGSVGQVVAFRLIQTYSDGSTQDITNSVGWAVSPTGLATIDTTGHLTCLAAGTVQVSEFQAGQPIQSVSYTIAAVALQSITIGTLAPSLTVGATMQLTASGAYTDGSQQDLTAKVRWNAANPAASISSTGLITAQAAGLAVLVATYQGIQGSLTLNIFAAANPNLQPQFRSHLTQVMQNYFDPKDVRPREGRYVLDAQLLNVPAQALEVADMKFDREISSTSLNRCAANIDNRGVYYKQALPPSFDFTTEHAVQGELGSGPVALQPYDDTLPVPTRVEADSRFSPVALRQPVLFTLSGYGVASAQTWAVQRVQNLTLPLAGRINFWLEGSGFNIIGVRVRITGQRAPLAAWASQQVTTSETLSLTQLGAAQSKFSWATIQEIQVSNLPAGLTLSGQLTGLGMSMVPDPTRPYTDPAYRDVMFARYWTYSEGLLREQFLVSNYQGFGDIQSYAAAPISAIAVEPNTYGIFVAQGSTLIYADRREPLPSNLNATALTTEPYYGIDLSLSSTDPNGLRYMLMRPVPYGQADQVNQYRYLVQTPQGTTYVLTPDGTLATYQSAAGWRRGAPIPLTIPLAQTGTYVITLQCAGPGNVILSDAAPYGNFAFTPKAQFDLSSIVPAIQGLAFDERGRLWVWSGEFALPLRLHYDAYLLDASTQALYLTDSVQGLIIDGVTV
jgi:hypothetical protein